MRWRESDRLKTACSDATCLQFSFHVSDLVRDQFVAPRLAPSPNQEDGATDYRASPKSRRALPFWLLSFLIPWQSLVANRTLFSYGLP
jgi:hypothetical protein